jgi:hypothetical protein
MFATLHTFWVYSTSVEAGAHRENYEYALRIDGWLVAIGEEQVVT